MSILTWIEDKKRLKILAAPKHVDRSADSSKGLWTRCDKCGVILYIKHLKENQRVCFGCSYHLQMMSQERIENLLDKMAAPSSFRRKKSGTGVTSSSRPGGARSSARETIVSTWRPLDETVSPCDPLHFHDQKDYTDRLRDAQERTGLQDAIQTGTGMIDGIPVALAVMDFSFMGGSMGSVVGEKLTRLVEYATQEGLTLLVVSASGGARMQEGVFSLMQMAKISSALQVYQKCANLLYISILSSPTTGGVTASFAMLGDIIFAEPKALIAFAGRRVIEQTLCEELPDDFQTSEYMLHHGLVDLIVPRRFLRQALSESIRLYQNAPFKKRGQIPFGVQNPITFLTEERIRRQWGAKGVTTSFAEQNQFCSARRKQSPLVRKTVVEESSKRSFVLRGSEDGALTGARTAVYREILTSFEIMLALFVSGNSKKQKQGNLFTSDKGGVTEYNLPKVGAGKTCRKLSGYVPGRLPVREGAACNTKSRSFFARVGTPKRSKSVSERVEELSTSQRSQPFLDDLALQGLTVRKSCFVRGGCCLQQQDKRFLMGFASQNVRTTLLTSRFFNHEYSISPNYRKNQPLYSLLNFRTFEKTSSLCDHAVTNFLGTIATRQARAKGGVRNQGCRAKLRNGNTPTPELFGRVVQPLSTPQEAKMWTRTLNKQPPLVHNSNGNNVLRGNKSFCTPGIKTVRRREPQKLLPALSSKTRVALTEQSRYKALFCNPCPSAMGKNKSKELPNSRKKQLSLVRAFVPSKQNRLKVGLHEPKKVKMPFSKHMSMAFSLKKTRGEETQAEAPIKNQRFSSSYGSNSCKARPSFIKQPFTKGDAKQNQSSFLLGHGTPANVDGSSVTTHSIKNLRSVKAKTKSMFSPAFPCCSYSATKNKATLYKELLTSKKLTDLLKEFEKTVSGPRLFSTSVTPYTRLKPSFVRETCFDFGLFSKSVPSQQKSDTTDPALALQDQFQEPGVRPERSRSNLLHTFRFFSEGTQILNNTPGTGFASPDNAINRSAIGMTHTVYLSQRALSSLRFVALQDQKEKVNSSAAHKFLQNKTQLSESLSSKGVQSVEKVSKDSSQMHLTSRENDIDFLNQAIELAATESIEWRAFYIHQQLSENTGFLEDFLQQDSYSRTKEGNVLFYKSICRSKKAVDK